MESHEPLTQSRAENKEQQTSGSIKLTRLSSLSTTGVKESALISCSHRARVVFSETAGGNAECLFKDAVWRAMLPRELVVGGEYGVTRAPFSAVRGRVDI